MGKVSRVEVGDAIYKEFDYVQSEGARLIDGFQYKYGRYDRVKINLKPGEFLFGYQYSDGRKEYCTTDGEFNVCFYSSGNDGNFDRLRVVSTFQSKQNWMHSARNIPFEKSAVGNIKGRMSELLYDGIADGVLKFTYREYVDGTAQPAFYEQVNYELSPSKTTTINFKGAEIEVLEVGNNKMTYKLIKGFWDR